MANAARPQPGERLRLAAARQHRRPVRLDRAQVGGDHAGAVRVAEREHRRLRRDRPGRSRSGTSADPIGVVRSYDDGTRERPAGSGSPRRRSSTSGATRTRSTTSTRGSGRSSPPAPGGRERHRGQPGDLHRQQRRRRRDDRRGADERWTSGSRRSGADTARRHGGQKVIRNRPADLSDACWTSADDADRRAVRLPARRRPARRSIPTFGDTRLAAGGGARGRHPQVPAEAARLRVVRGDVHRRRSSRGCGPPSRVGCATDASRGVDERPPLGTWLDYGP